MITHDGQDLSSLALEEAEKKYEIELAKLQVATSLLDIVALPTLIPPPLTLL